MNEHLAYKTLQEAIQQGVSEFCVCPGARNGPLYVALMQATSLKKYFWPEERSAAFFALGRSRATNRPVAVITTSGTAAGELLPAAMEAYYTGIPLLLITADRPRRFRGSGAPQAAEQVELFGVYTTFAYDVAANEEWDISSWTCLGPAHLNVCFEEPFPKNQAHSFNAERLVAANQLKSGRSLPNSLHDLANRELDRFLDRTIHPVVVVSTLKAEDQEPVAKFLSQLNAPIYLEGISGLREDPRLQHLRLYRSDKLLQDASQHGYEIDGVLRIGGVPTFRPWRDLEEKEGKIAVCAISNVPFSGLSWAEAICVPLETFFKNLQPKKSFQSHAASTWLEANRTYWKKLSLLFAEEPTAEASLVHHLSKQMAQHSCVYLGNSLPIREWDLAASHSGRPLGIHANRGVNGIDGQLSTFFGLCDPKVDNWGIFGDLTTLYDMVSPWILSQLDAKRINLVVVNNGGGQIFSRFLNEKEFLNTHQLSFDSLAKFWGMPYEKWDKIPERIESGNHPRFIEIIPDPHATARLNRLLA